MTKVDVFILGRSHGFPLSDGMPYPAMLHENVELSTLKKTKEKGFYVLHTDRVTEEALLYQQTKSTAHCQKPPNSSKLIDNVKIGRPTGYCEYSVGRWYSDIDRTSSLPPSAIKDVQQNPDGSYTVDASLLMPQNDISFARHIDETFPSSRIPADIAAGIKKATVETKQTQALHQATNSKKENQSARGAKQTKW
jgi:hypothetical protein